MRDCENCIYARPFGGENDNRCTAWSCEYIPRKEAIELYKSVTRCKDCKYAEKETEDAYWCNEWGGSAVADGFCSWGENKPESLLEAMVQFRAEEGADK